MTALYSHTTRASGITLTAAIYNADHENHITNGVPAQLDDYSATATEMRLNTDPGESGTESLPTTLAGELERLRFVIKEMKTPLNGGVAVAQWYTTASGSVSGTVADGSITMAKLADLAGLSIIGRSANTTGVPAAITGTDGQVLRVSGTTLGFGTIPSTSVTGLGTAAAVNTGTSGNTIGKLNTANSWSEVQSLTPQTLSAGTNNNFAVAASRVVNTSGSTATVTGMSAEANGAMVVFQCINTDNIEIKNENAGSSAANRFTCDTGLDITLSNVGDMAIAFYDTVSSRWIVREMA